MFYYIELVRGLVYITYKTSSVSAGMFRNFYIQYFSSQRKTECNELTSSGVPIKAHHNIHVWHLKCTWKVERIVIK